MKKLFITIFITSILFSCTNSKKEINPIIEFGKITSKYEKTLQPLITEQNETTDVDRMFALDSIIAKEKEKATDTLKIVFKQLGIDSLIFIQTANTEKINIQSIKIVDIEYNKIKIEAKVKALENSAFEGPFAGITGIATDGSTVDIGGGIAADSKLIAGQEYIFKGEIFNIKNITDNFKYIVFSEDIEKW